VGEILGIFHALQWISDFVTILIQRRKPSIVIKLILQNLVMSSQLARHFLPLNLQTLALSFIGDKQMK